MVIILKLPIRPVLFPPDLLGDRATFSKEYVSGQFGLSDTRVK